MTWKKLKNFSAEKEPGMTQYHLFFMNWEVI